MSRRKLLLADDSVTIQKVVNLTFADEGIEVFAVGNGNDAVDRLMEIAPDLVMADVNMPGLNGYQVCERIKQNERFKNTPVILLVGSFEPFDEQEAQRVGADDFLTKPFQSIRQLVSKVTDLLERTGEQAEMSSSAAASSFADTQEMPQPVTAEPAPYEAPRYDDAEIDDEMIQTNSPSSFAFDEAPKFASRNYVEPREEDYGKTQPLSAADLREIEPAPDEPVNDSPEQSAGEASPPQTASVYDSDDDDDLLEIPFDEDEFEDEEEEAEIVQAQTASPTSGESYEAEAAGEMTPTAEAENIEPQAQTENIQAVEAETVQPDESESAPAEMESAPPEEIESTPPAEAESASPSDTMAAASAASNQLSPEMIDAIAQRVIEKLSASAVKEIAWEVVPQQADVIIKKMVEEKLKE